MWSPTNIVNTLDAGSRSAPLRAGKSGLTRRINPPALFFGQISPWIASRAVLYLLTGTIGAHRTLAAPNSVPVAKARSTCAI